MRRAAQPRGARRAHRLLRRADRVSRGHRGHLAGDHRANLHRAPDPRRDAVICYQDRKRVAAALRPIYTAPTVEAAECELLAFAESELGRRYPAAVATWENAWERFIPFLAFPPEVRRIIYTTNSIESLNYQLRKIIKNRGHFPTDDAVIKLLWLAIRDIEDKRARARAKEKGISRDQRKAPHRLVEGASVQG